MFRYDLHVHTNQGSACGHHSGAEVARFYKDLGYQGIFITDHFFRGSTRPPKELPWKERIEMFCSGYEDALIQGQKIGLDVFFGWEENYFRDEYLIYGLNQQFMLGHPEMEHWTRREQVEAVHAAGGCIIQAHPFRMRFYIHSINVGDGFADGVEVANATNTPQQDTYAWQYAQHYGLYTVSASDAHICSPERQYFGVGLEQRLTSSADWVQHVLTRGPHTLLCSEERFHADLTQEPLLPAYRVEPDESLSPLNMDWLNP